MADLFSPKIKGDPSYERPVQTPQEAPTFFEGLSKIGEAAIDTFTAYERAEKKSRSSSGYDPNLAVFAEDIKTAEKIRMEQGEQAAKLYQRKIGKKFASYGFSFDENYQQVYEQITGRDWEFWGLDTDEYMLQQAFNDPTVKSLMIASMNQLPEGASLEDRVAWSTEKAADLNRAKYNLQRQKLMIEGQELGQRQSEINSQREWTTKNEANAHLVLDTFSQTLSSDLKSLSDGGGVIDGSMVDRLKAEYTILKRDVLFRPPNITDSQWASVNNRLKQFDNMFTFLEETTSNEALLERITTTLAKSILRNDGSPDSLLTAMAILSGDAPKMLVESGKLEVFDNLSKFADLNESLFDLPSQIQPGLEPFVTGGQVESGTVPDLPPDVKSSVKNFIDDATKDITPSSAMNHIKAGSEITSSVSGGELQTKGGKELFVKGVGAIGAALTVGDSNSFFSHPFLKKNVGNDAFLRKMESLRQLDPELYLIAREALLEGVATESSKQSKNLSSIERSVRGAKWDGTNYIVDTEGLAELGVNPSLSQGLLDLLDRHYGGNLTEGAKDGFRRIRSSLAVRSSSPTVGGEENILHSGGLYDLAEAIDRRESIKLLDKVMSSLGGTSADEPQGFGEAGVAEVEQPSVGDVVLALGTNDFSNPEQAANNTRELIREVKARGGNPVIVPPNVNSEQFRAVADAIIAVANEEGATIEMAQYDPNDPLHLTMSEAERIGQKYSGAQVVGDSNAVRIMGMRETDLTKTGAGTGALLEAFKGTSQQFEPTEPQRAGEQVSIGVKLPSDIEPEFVSKATSIARDLGISNPDDLFTVMSFETGGKVTSDVRNEESGAVGLIQFTNIGIRDLDVTKDELARMDRIEQLDYVERYFQPYKGKMKNLGDVYMAVFSPIGVGKPEDFPLYRAPSREYDQNREMDADNDGVITRGDALKKVMAHKRRIMK